MSGTYIVYPTSGTTGSVSLVSGVTGSLSLSGQVNTGTLTAGNVVTVGSNSQLSTIPYSAATNNGSLVVRDVNGATTALNFVSGTTTVQSSGTSNLIVTAASTRIQKIIGSNTTNVTLPIATNLYSGQMFEINNNTTQTSTVFNTGSATITTVVSGGYANLICVDNTTANGVWDVHFDLPANATYGTSGLRVAGFVSAAQGTLGSVTITSSTGGSAYTVNFPGTQASSTSSILIANGLGGLYWSPNQSMTFTTISTGSGTYTPPVGVRALWVRGCGGGGGAGGVSCSVSFSGGSGGGGAGGYFEHIITTPNINAAGYTYNIGDGGPGGAAGINNGTTGSSTTFSGGSTSLIGGGGIGSSGIIGQNSAGFPGGPAGGGSASGGNILNVKGGSGTFGINTSGTSAISGSGGANPLCSSVNGRGGNNTGNNGIGPGSGGGGGTQNNNNGNSAGGNGITGILIIGEIF